MATADPSAPGMTPLVEIRRMNFVEITKLILNGEVTAAVQNGIGARDFRHILVDNDAIKNEVFSGEPAGTVPMFRVTDALKCTATAVRELASLGEIDTVTAIGPRGNPTEFYLQSSIKDFLENYVSRKTLARYRVKHELEEFLAGVAPAFTLYGNVRFYKRLDLPKR
jgi:hypothetical protein